MKKRTSEAISVKLPLQLNRHVTVFVVVVVFLQRHMCLIPFRYLSLGLTKGLLLASLTDRCWSDRPAGDLFAE